MKLFSQFDDSIRARQTSILPDRISWCIEYCLIDSDEPQELIDISSPSRGQHHTSQDRGKRRPRPDCCTLLDWFSRAKSLESESRFLRGGDPSHVMLVPILRLAGRSRSFSSSPLLQLDSGQCDTVGETIKGALLDIA